MRFPDRHSGFLWGVIICLSVGISASCGSDPLGVQQIAGTYELASYNGNALPAQIASTTTTRTVVTAGTMTLTTISPNQANGFADFSFTRTHTIEVTVIATGAKTVSTSTISGTAFYHDGGSIIYSGSTDPFGSGSPSGRVDSNSVTYGLYEYRK